MALEDESVVVDFAACAGLFGATAAVLIGKWLGAFEWLTCDGCGDNNASGGGGGGNSGGIGS